MEKKLEKIYKKCYKLLERVTPLPVDCGQLCKGACCKGDEDTGMLLFPGEEEFFTDDENFILKETEFELSDGFVIKLLVCKDDCDRKKRPLACRIFPLFVDCSNEDFRPFIDPRAKGCCPLALVGIDEGISTKFIVKTVEVFKALVQDSRNKEFIDMLNEDLNFDLEVFCERN